MLWQPEATLAAPWGPTKVSHNDARAATRIVVIGAGIAGCTAARQLQALGFSVKVLEARSRVGGRIHTTQISGYATAGAAASATRDDKAGRTYRPMRLACVWSLAAKQSGSACERIVAARAELGALRRNERRLCVVRMRTSHVACCIPRARLRARMCVCCTETGKSGWMCSWPVDVGAGWIHGIGEHTNTFNPLYALSQQAGLGLHPTSDDCTLYAPRRLVRSRLPTPRYPTPKGTCAL